jgi:hypothetical protein
LQIFVNNDRVLDKLIEGPLATQVSAAERRPPATEVSGAERHWEHIHLDLSTYRKQPVVIRLYDLILVPGHEAGNSYWKQLELQ